MRSFLAALLLLAALLCLSASDADNYAAYLAELGKTSPDSITAYDRALSAVLAKLRDFTFIDDPSFLATGIAAEDIAIKPGFTVPRGAKVSISRVTAFRINAAADRIELSGVIAKSGKDVPLEIYFVGDEFFLGQFQLAEDTVIAGVPCRAAEVDPWDVTLALHPSGRVWRAVLAADYAAGGVEFLAGERVEFDPEGRPLAAALSKDRAILGRPVAAVIPRGMDARRKGLWSGPTPSVYFSDGKVRACYERDISLGGKVVPGVYFCQYSKEGALEGITPPSPYFMGYPVKLGIPKPTWDWSMPGPSIDVAGDQASFRVDLKIELSSGGKKVSLEEGALVTVDLATGACLGAVQPDGARLSFAAKDGMRPELVPPERVAATELKWLDIWIKTHPEAVDGSNRELRAARVALRERIAGEIELAERAAGLRRLLASVLLYKEKAKGLVPGNIAFDANGDGKLQAAEMVPASLATLPGGEADIDALLAHFVDEVAGKLTKAQLKALSAAMGKEVPIGSFQESLGKLDALGAILARAGFQPFAARRICYLPDGTGVKLLAKKVDYYPSGIIKKVVYDEQGLREVPPLKVWFPTVGEFVEIWWYDAERVAGPNWAEGTFDTMNALYFYETGAISAVGPFPYAMVKVPAALGCSEPLIQIHGIRWNPDGTIYQLFGCRGNPPLIKWTLPGGIVVQNPFMIEWWRFDPRFAIKVFLNNFGDNSVTVRFPKGVRTFYRIGKAGKIEAYTRTFKEDTDVVITTGFFLSDKGEVTDYW